MVNPEDPELIPVEDENRCLNAAIEAVNRFAPSGAPQRLYIMHQECQEIVKIVVAIDVKVRRKQIQIGTPHSVVVLASIPGGEPLERALHAVFARYRVAGEWFLVVGALARFIVHLLAYECYRASRGRTQYVNH